MKKQDALNNIKIAQPCPVRWETMDGDERVRFCNLCKLNVYNISEMSSQDALELLQKSEGRTCVRLMRRKDGTVMTNDCPVGLRKARALARRAVAAAIAAMAWIGVPMQAQAQSVHQGGVECPPMNGQVISVPSTTTKPIEKREAPTWPLAIPAVAGMIFMIATRKRRNRSVVRLGIALGAVLLATGIIWGLISSGMLPLTL